MITALLTVMAFAQARQSPGLERPPVPVPSPSAEAIASDTGVLRHASGRIPPVAHSFRISGPAPHLDGRLDDAAWESATPITDFYQNVPNEGLPASERTEVRILYDDDAIYVGARMFDREPALVRTQLARRDNTDNADVITVAFDSYLDHRTSFQFRVNPSSVRGDGITSGDASFGDDSWDPVWEARAQRDSLGWSAEMRIPFSQLRFSTAPEQTWGLNISRYIQRKAENSEFAWKAQTEQGYASYFGHLFGLARLPQPRRLELLPYTTARSAFGPAEAGNPFQDGSRTDAAGGLDLKYGLTSSLTVDATFNPDFGQVEQDPAFVNLSAFEQFLQERRPFFVEGQDIFSFGGQQFFYSRRIGSPPHGSPNDHSGFTTTPDNTTILGATKLTGRPGRGWSLGFLEALTAREYGTIDSSGARFSDEVEPLTNYAIGRVKRDLRGGASTVGAMVTAVNRSLRGNDLLFLRGAAYAGGVDFSHRFKANQYSVSGSLAGSYVQGDTLAIQRAQLSSARYYQRPDADYVDYAPARTALTGWTGQLAFARLQGNLTYRLTTRATSPGFEINDAGFQRRGDDAFATLNVNRRWTRPGKLFRSANWGGDLQGDWNFGGVRTSTGIGSYAYGQFLNYWSINGSAWFGIRAASDVLTRGGPLGVSPQGINANVGFNSDYRKPWQVYGGTYYFTNEIQSSSAGFYGGLTLRPSASMQFEVNPSFDNSTTIQQFLGSQPDPSNTAMFGQQYFFAAIRQQSIDLTTRLNMTFSPALSLQLFLQPFVATGAYDDFKELTQPRTTNFIRYGQTPGSTIDTTFNGDGSVASYTVDPDGAGGSRPSYTVGNPDFAFRSLRGNAVLRWEYRPGSTLFLVWTQSCGYFSQNPGFSPSRDFRQLCQGRSNNVVAVKFNYWLSL